MIVREFFLNEETGGLYVEFSTIEDKDDFYRILELTKDEVEYYSPFILEDFDDIDEEFVRDMLIEYSKNNELPGEEIL